jgi:hypothetical protein
MSYRTLIVLSILIAPLSASAQNPAFTCNDYRGYPVTRIDATIAGGAEARTLPTGQPIIVVNPAMMAPLPPAFRDFVYAHECAHHVLGHGSVAPISESLADCWAIRTLVFQYGMPPAGVAQIRNTILSVGVVGPTGHDPAPVRQAKIGTCALSPN